MIEVEELKTLKTILINRVTEQLGDPNLNASRLINALADLTVHDASEPDIGWEKAKYHATRLAVELGNAKNDADKDRRYINRIWKDMIEAFEVIEPSIENDTQKAGLRKILKPKKTDPKTGRVEFYLDVQEVEEREAYPVEQAGKNDHTLVINYELVKRPKATLLGRLFSSIVLHDHAHTIYRYLPVILFLYVVFASMYLLISEEEWFRSPVLIFSSLIILYLFYEFRAFWLVGPYRIVQAPLWMTKLQPGEEAQLRVQQSGQKNSLGEVIPEIALVVYQSKCPICESTVRVDNGRGQFKGRLIGKCELNPVEHIYSFDYYTQKGLPLRKDIYFG